MSENEPDRKPIIAKMKQNVQVSEITPERTLSCSLSHCNCGSNSSKKKAMAMYHRF